MTKSYSHIVIGGGAIGSAAAYWLTQRGATNVLVIEQFELLHSLGSSGDHSRIIRRSYHLPEYTVLTDAMFEAWDHVEARSGLQVYLKTGGLDVADAGSAGAAEIQTYKAAMAEVGITSESMTGRELRARYPQWRVDDDAVALYQEDGGLIDIRKAVSTHLSLALAEGVEVLPRTKVTGIDVGSTSVRVETTAGTFEAGNLIVAAASWLEELMPDLGLDFSLTLSQEQVGYFSSRNLADFVPEKHPIWAHHGDELFYGFPVYGEAATKIGRDMRGHYVTSKGRSFEPDTTEPAHLETFLSKYLPGAVGPLLASKTCLYDMPADRHFIIDTVPGNPHVAVFNGAGHAGKFSSLMGSIMADLTTEGSTKHPIDLFSLSRPALTDPQFAPVFRLTA